MSRALRLVCLALALTESPMNSTTLVFSSYDGPTQGFTNNDVDRDGTKDPIVIRELIQNGLDAAKARGVKVSLRLVDVPLTDIPHIDAYRFAFNQARMHLQVDEPATGRHAIDRIQKALNSSKIPCLFCIDDGEGIDPEALRGLYSSGRSTKKISEGSRGSVGNGHLTAFAPSDLRYVLYAGLCTDGVATFGGHAILATHRIETKSRMIEERSHHGYIRESRDQLALFADERGGDHIPSVMSRYLQSSRQTGVSGSVVMITGYNPIFNSAADDELFLSSTAQHFTVAAFDESLTVDYAYGQKPPESLDRGSLQHWVQSIRINRDKRRTVRTLRTLETGEKLETDGIGAGVRVWFRRSIDPHEIDRPRVAIFRDGMWIKDNPSGLEPRVFSDVRPFDAVVDLNSSYEFGSLVKEAEGVSHLEINPREITDGSQKKRLTKLIDDLRELLSDSAAPVGDIEDYEPPELKVFSAVATVMKKIPPPQPKKSKEEEDLPVELPETSPDSSEQLEPSEPSEPSESRPGVEPRSRPPLRPGRTTGLSVSCRPYSNSGNRFLISWKTEGSVLPSGAAGLRLFVPSGTDRASANHVPARYLDMISITGIDPSSPPYCSPGSQEAVIIDPSGVAEITIDPRQAAELLRGQELGIVRAELVHRKSSRVSHE